MIQESTRFAPTGTVFSEFKYQFVSHNKDDRRVYYASKNPSGGRSLWCFQYDGPLVGITFYACTAEGEPEHQCKFPDPDEFNKLVSPHPYA